jgi:hypothetical protein
MSATACVPALPDSSAPTHETLLALREESIATARAEIEAAMAAECRTAHTIEEMCRLCPRPPPDPNKECSSVTSASSEPEEDIESDSGDDLHDLDEEEVAGLMLKHWCWHWNYTDPVIEAGDTAPPLSEADERERRIRKNNKVVVTGGEYEGDKGQVLAINTDRGEVTIKGCGEGTLVLPLDHVKKIRRKRWALSGPVLNWAETRCAHITECFKIFCENGFMYFDEVHAADQRVMKCMLHVVKHEYHWAYFGYMASPAFWACVFVMQTYSLRPEGYEVRNKSQEVLDHSSEAWTLDNMHKILAGDKSKTFKDSVQSEEYKTCVPGGRKGISRAVTRGNLKLRKLGVHNLGGEFSRKKKMRTRLQLMQLAGVERPHQRICDMQPPTTKKLKPSNSAREQAMERIESEWDANEASRRETFMQERAAMLGTRCAVKPKRPASPIKAYWHPANREDDRGVVDIGDGTFAAAKSQAVVHADADGEAASLGPVALPSDDEEDERGERDDAISRLLSKIPCPAAEPATMAKPAAPSVAETRVASPVRMPPLDFSTPDRSARKAAKRARKEAAAAAAPPAPAPMQMDPEVQAMEEAMAEMAAKQAEMAAKLAAAKQAAAASAAEKAARQDAEQVAFPSLGGDSDSSELSSSEGEDAGDGLQGPREETGDETSELVPSAMECDGGGSDNSDDSDDLAFINANRQEAACPHAHEQAVAEAAEDAKNTANKVKQLERSEKARLHQKAINEGRTNVPLSKEELRLLEWREGLDKDLLECGIIQKIRKKHETPFHIQMRRRREESEKQRRRDARRALKDARAELKHLQAIERAENKEEARKRFAEQLAAKVERRRGRDSERIGRANKKLNDSIKKHVADAKAKKERKQQRAREQLANAQKYGRNAIVHFGGDEEGASTKFTLFIAPPKPEKPVVPPRLPKRNGYAICELSCEQHERLDKYGVPTPLEQADPYKRVTLDLEPASNGTRSTRGAAAVKLRKEREDALKRQRDADATLPSGEGGEASPAKRARMGEV